MHVIPNDLVGAVGNLAETEMSYEQFLEILRRHLADCHGEMSTLEEHDSEHLHALFHFGVFVDYWNPGFKNSVTPRHESLKEELMANSLGETIGSQMYEQLERQCQDYLRETKWKAQRRQRVGKNCNDPDYWSPGFFNSVTPKHKDLREELMSNNLTSFTSRLYDEFRAKAEEQLAERPLFAKRVGSNNEICCVAVGSRASTQVTIEGTRDVHHPSHRFERVEFICSLSPSPLLSVLLWMEYVVSVLSPAQLFVRAHLRLWFMR